MAEYNKPCDFCKVEIRMSNNSGKWLPLDLDGSPHKCGGSNQNQKQNGYGESYSIEDRLRKLETAVFGAPVIQKK